MRIHALALGLVFLVVGCGGGSPSVRDARSAAGDPLVFVPDSVDALMRFDLARIRAEPAFGPILARAASSFGPVAGLLTEVPVWWFAGDFDGPDDEDAYIMLCSVPPDLREEVAAELENNPAPDGFSQLTPDGTLIIAAAGMGDDVERIMRRGRRGVAPVVEAMRRTQNERRELGFVTAVFLPSDAMREAFVQSAEESEARIMLQRIANGVRTVEGVVSASQGEVAVDVDFVVPEDEDASLVAMMLEMMHAAEPEAPESPIDELTADWMARMDIRRDAGHVRTHASVATIAGAAERMRSLVDQYFAESAAAPRTTTRRAPFFEEYRRGEFRTVVDGLAPERDALLARLAQDPSALPSLGVLVDAYVQLGQTTDALALLEAIDARVRETGMTVHPNHRAALDQTAVTALELRGDYARALARIDAAPARAGDPIAAAQREDVRGFLLAKMQDEARCLAATRSAVEALPARRLDGAQAASSESFTIWLSGRNNLAWTYGLLGRAEEGLAIMEPLMTLIEGDERVLQPSRAAYLNTLGFLLFEAGRFRESVAAHREEFQIRSTIFREDDPRRAFSLLHLSRAETRAGQPDKGLRHARMALTLADRGRGPTHPETALAHLRIAEALHASGSAADARTEAEEAVRIYGLSTEPTHVDRREAEAFLRSLR